MKVQGVRPPYRGSAHINHHDRTDAERLNDELEQAKKRASDYRYRLHKQAGRSGAKLMVDVPG